MRRKTFCMCEFGERLAESPAPDVAFLTTEPSIGRRTSSTFNSRHIFLRFSRVRWLGEWIDVVQRTTSVGDLRNYFHTVYTVPIQGCDCLQHMSMDWKWGKVAALSLIILIGNIRLGSVATHQELELAFFPKVRVSLKSFRGTNGPRRVLGLWKTSLISLSMAKQQRSRREWRKKTKNESDESARVKGILCNFFSSLWSWKTA